MIDGIAGLGLPPRAVSALGLLRPPAADGLRNLVQSDAFVDVWTGAVPDAHRALTKVATSNGKACPTTVVGPHPGEGRAHLPRILWATTSRSATCGSHRLWRAAPTRRKLAAKVPP